MIKLSKFYIVAMCAALMVTGCAQKKNPSNVEENHYTIVEDGIDYLSVEGLELEPGTEIAMIASDLSSDFYSIVKQGAEQAITDLNTELGYTGKNKITFSYAAPKKENVVDQINIIDQFLDKAPNALCIAFSDATACKTQLQMARNNGIHLVAFDAPDDSGATEAMIATDNYEAAAKAAAKMFTDVNYEGKVAVIVHNSVKQTGQERYRAITNQLKENYSNKNLRVVDVVYLAQDNRSEKEILDALLEKHPDLAGIICTDMVTTEMTIDYAKKLDERNFSIVGFDISEKIVDAVNDGTILGTVAQDPYRIGYATVVAAARTILEMENAENIQTGHLWIDTSNVNSKEVQGLLVE